MTTAKKKFPVWVYFYSYGARGFGHIGIIITRSNGKLVRYSQGAINPRDSMIRLIITSQKAKVSKKVFPPLTTPRFIVKDAKLAKVYTQDPDKIEDSIEQYINKDRNYHSLFNNCAGFISIALNATSDITIKHYYIPKNLFVAVSKMALTNQR